MANDTVTLSMTPELQQMRMAVRRGFDGVKPKPKAQYHMPGNRCDYCGKLDWDIHHRDRCSAYQRHLSQQSGDAQ